MKIKEGNRFVMIGDSITDCGRVYDAGLASLESLGDGYVRLVDAFLTSSYPENKIMVINQGISGNTIVDLENRWDQDVISLHPDWVSIMIGINDVWRHFDGILQQCDLVSLELFKTTYQKLIDKTKKEVGSNILIISPFMIETNMNDSMRLLTCEYAAAAKELAIANGLIYVDVQAKIDKFLESLPNYILSGDRVHPNLKGHSIIAKAILDEIGFDWSKA